nr:hypothetical protein [Tanacetum cinerariifolium]
MESISKAVEFKAMSAYVKTGKVLKMAIIGSSPTGYTLAIYAACANPVCLSLTKTRVYGLQVNPLLPVFERKTVVEKLCPHCRNTPTLKLLYSKIPPNKRYQFLRFCWPKKSALEIFLPPARKPLYRYSLLPHQMAPENIRWNSSRTNGFTQSYIDIGDCEWTYQYCDAKFWDLELPNVILKRTYATVEKIKEKDEEDTNSVENTSG